jgi:hypothetical protein
VGAALQVRSVVARLREDRCRSLDVARLAGVACTQQRRLVGRELVAFDAARGDEGKRLSGFRELRVNVTISGSPAA